jgi:flagellar motor switch protein FliN/FliY
LQSSAASAPEIPGSSSGSRNLDLLLDIELGASLRFGTRQMLLKDIIELCSGSVVELDRRVQEPVDLLIDGRVIAQGEVVIVDGNYGLRIVQVATPIEKIACLPS